RSSTLSLLGATPAGLGVSSAASVAARSIRRSRSWSGSRRIVARISSMAPITDSIAPFRGLLFQREGPAVSEAHDGGSGTFTRFVTILTQQIQRVTVEAPGIEEELLGDSERNQRHLGTAAETDETKIGRVEVDRAAELAARQTPPRP